jgi:hypothetical protein
MENINPRLLKNTGLKGDRKINLCETYSTRSEYSFKGFGNGRKGIVQVLRKQMRYVDCS